MGTAFPLDAAPPGAPTRAERQSRVVGALRRVLPAHALLWHAEDTVPYECDGLTAYRERPLVVALSRQCPGRVGMAQEIEGTARRIGHVMC